MEVKQKKVVSVSTDDKQTLRNLMGCLMSNEDSVNIEIEPETAQVLERLMAGYHKGGRNSKTDVDRVFIEFNKMQQDPDHSEALKAYAAGFFGAIACFKIYCPYTSDQVTERINWMTSQILTQKSNQNTIAQLNAQRLAKNITFNKDEFRAMLFNRARVSSDGDDIDPATGQPTEEIIPYGRVEYQRKSDGMYVSPEYLGVDKMDDDHVGTISIFTDSDTYYPVRVMYAELGGERIVIRTNDHHLIAAMIEEDIAIGDPINKRYLKEAVDNPKFAPYRDTIFEASSAIRNTEIAMVEAPSRTGTVTTEVAEDKDEDNTSHDEKE